EASSILRYYDDFLASQIRRTQSVTSQLETEFTHASRLDDMLGDPQVGLDPAMQGFFNALGELADDPASAAARQLVLVESESLADRFNYFFLQYERLRVEANQELALAVDQVNAIAENIAVLNQQISLAWSAGGRVVPNDLLDQRDLLLNDLSKLVNVNTLEQDDHAINVIIGNGQPLVVGSTTTPLSVEVNGSDTLNPDIALTLGGSSVTVTAQITGGELGGLLAFRSEYIDTGLNRLGQLAAGLVASVNAQHTQGIDLYGSMGGNFFSPVSAEGAADSGNSGTGAVSVTLANVEDLTASDYRLTFNGGTSYTLTRLSDGATTAIDTSTTVPVTDGFQMAITAGAVAGDSFLIRPTRSAANEVSLLITDPNRLAVAGALRSGEVTDAAGNPLNSGSGVISQAATSSATGLPLAASITLTYTTDADGSSNPGFSISGGPGGYILYNPATGEVDGKDFPDGSVPGQFDLYGGLSFRVSGTPSAGDQFIITNNSGGRADNRNALALAALQSADLLNGGTTTLQGGYAQLVA
ncbi:MAG: flagellar hook-associated protein FlgK, partial [Candidatus Sedimenticola endophacoides]